MPAVSSCPDPKGFAGLVRGEGSAEEIEELAQHIEQCPSCALTVENLLSAGDTLAEALRNKTTGNDEAEEPVVQDLIERLQSLHPSAPQETLDNYEPRSIEPNVAGTATQTEQDAPPADFLAELRDLLAPAQGPDELGRLGHYRVLKVLGAGGMGLVLQAEDLQLGRLVALKVMRPAAARHPSATQRFLREARAAAALKHDHIVTIHTVGEERGVPFLAIEFLEGEALESRLQRDKKLPISEVVRIGREIALGLAAAHKRGLVHRDIKPANIWLEDRDQESGLRSQEDGRTSRREERRESRGSGRVKILDFGLARAAEEDVALTQSGMIVGTPAYMAPEQARGNHVDARCDLFSLGVVLYRMSTGELPFSGNSAMAILTALAVHTPPTPRELNPGVLPALSDLIMKLLAKAPDQRFRSAEELVRAFSALETQDWEKVVPAETRAARPPRLLRLALAVATVSVLFLIVASIVLFWQTPQGTVRIEIVDDEITAQFDKNGADVLKKGIKEFRLEPGPFGLHVKGRGFDFHTDKLILTKNETVTLKVEFVDGKVLVKKGNEVWKEVAPEKENAVDSPAKNSPFPLSLAEPLPLAEWLKGRTILTVSQDGKGQFKTIQAALSALKPGQVVKVLDRGPYRENLDLPIVPEDCGLISAQQTIVTFTEFAKQFGKARLGHYFGSMKGLRLHGFQFTVPAKPEGHYGILFADPSGLVLENCCVHVVGPDVHGTSAFSANWFHEAAKPAWVRDCLVRGRFTLSASQNGRATAVVERNFLDGPGNQCIYVYGPFRKLAVRFNVLGGHVQSSDVNFDELKDVEILEISNNTTLAAKPFLFSSTVPGGNVIIRNNLRIQPGLAAIVIEGGATLVRDKWQVSHNAYPRELRHGEFDYVKQMFLPRAPQDVLGEARFLSSDALAPDYLRVSADSPQAKGGAGGAWPSYIGALPPGPAPKDGDWFTRLRQRWRDVVSKEATLPPPLDIPEPPPLAEWLKGRTILTVSQDGKGQFKTIQAALDALKPGQVVKVLDRGPYRERLYLSPVPEDTGLISEQRTVLELSEWKDFPWAKETPLGHFFGHTYGFRLHGFALIFKTSRKNGHGLDSSPANGFVLENCLVETPPGNDLGAAVMLAWWGDADAKPAWVRDCYIRGQLSFSSSHGRAVAVVERNYLGGPGLYALEFGAHFAKILVRHNIFGGGTKHSDLSFVGLGNVASLDVHNNTTTSPYPLYFSPQGKNVSWPTMAAATRSIRNNLRSQPGLIMQKGISEKTPLPVVPDWQVSHNAYPRQLRHGELGLTKKDVFPQVPSDVVEEPRFLSLDKTHKDFLRIPVGSPQATGGAGGAWPSYIGALPPGPAPKEGDWFTRLRQRWRDVVSKEATLPPPLNIPEPPPLAEWLKGRTVLTVSQDGKGQFKTIQAALDALKPGQVVKVLDRGPYRECLVLNPVPEDTGLISEQQTVLELSWRTVKGSKTQGGHILISTEGFRMHGFAMIIPPSRGGFGFQVNDPSGFVLENCLIQIPDIAEPMAATMLNWVSGTNHKPAWIRDCMFRGTLILASPKKSAFVVERNYLDGPGAQALLVTGDCRKVVIRHNVFGGRVNLADIGINGMKAVDTLEIRNNTTTSACPLSFAFSAPAKNVIIRNNLHSQPGLLVMEGGPEKDMPALTENWRVGHNGYPRQLRHGEIKYLAKINIFPQAADDVLADPKFLSADPLNPDYLRLPADSLLAKGGAGGDLPRYIGALPPGPSPKEGDWFTRLRERWKDHGK